MSAHPDSRSLPDRPDLEQLKKQAKALRDGYRAGDQQAVDLVRRFERDPHSERFGLQDEGHLEAVKCLLDLGADVNARNSAGQTPLQIAVERFWPNRAYDPIVDVLLAYRADKNGGHCVKN